jgi:hypothetical protein
MHFPHTYFMNYSRIYNAIIEKAQNRNLVNTYTETHHITPRCMMGTDDKNNLVELLAREHLLCHLLLVKMNPGHRGLAKAAAAMSMKNEYTKERITCRKYAFLREAVAAATSAQFKNIPKSEKHKEKIRQKSRRPENVAKLVEMNKTLPWTEERRKKVSEANSKRIITEEERQRLANLTLGRKATDEEKAAMSARRKGKPRIISEQGKADMIQKLTGREITWRDKISKTLMGKHPSQETRQKMADSKRGTKQSPETIAKRVETQRRNREAKRLALLETQLPDTSD